jgi:hypothetical protein
MMGEKLCTTQIIQALRWTHNAFKRCECWLVFFFLVQIEKRGLYLLVILYLIQAIV